MKQLSLKMIFIMVACCAICSAVIAGLLHDEEYGYSVSQGYSQAGGGGQFAFAHSGEAFSKVGHPTFITNRATSKAIPYFNELNMPYLLVVHHPRNSEIDFESKFVLDGIDISVRNTLTIDGLKLPFEHGFDEFGGAEVREFMTVDSNQIDLSAGRIIEIRFSGGAFKISKQINSTKIPAGPFQQPYRIDHPSDRVKPILKWWRDFELNGN